MNRKYDTARFFAVTELLRRYFPGCALTCDLITGFPGETDADQAETLAFIEKCAFSDMHIFPYSVRPRTAAADMPEQVSKEVKHLRARRAAAVAAELERRFLEGRVGTVQPVLFETEHSGVFLGHAPNYCEVEVKGENLRDKVKNVQIISVNGDKLVGNIIL
jgi:threonylcarbamoyladenosine tRNA methylthiotransferase MtaB